MSINNPQSSAVKSPMVSRWRENQSRSYRAFQSIVQDVLTVIGMTDPPEIYVEESSLNFFPGRCLKISGWWVFMGFLFFSQGWLNHQPDIWLDTVLPLVSVGIAGYSMVSGRDAMHLIIFVSAACWIPDGEFQETREIEIDCPGMILGLRHYKKSHNRP